MSDEVKKFTEACIEKGKFEEVGNSKDGNKQYIIIHSAYLSLVKDNRLNELLVLLNHENPYVKLWAAGYTLQIAPVQAEKALLEVDELDENVGFGAEMTLREWRKGTLKV